MINFILWRVTVMILKMRPDGKRCWYKSREFTWSTPLFDQSITSRAHGTRVTQFLVLITVTLALITHDCVPSGRLLLCRSRFSLRPRPWRQTERRMPWHTDTCSCCFESCDQFIVVNRPFVAPWQTVIESGMVNVVNLGLIQKNSTKYIQIHHENHTKGYNHANIV